MSVLIGGPKIQTSKLWSAAVLGCSIARGWIQLMLLVMLVAAGLFLRFSGSCLMLWFFILGEHSAGFN